ncbi:MAG: sugar ABC transporter permease [Eubacteriales bacterium]|nr:sugar ABC transporter permease [Eubacteriales bacterium]
MEANHPKIGVMERRKRKQGLLLIAPAFLVLLCISGYALAWAFTMSFSSNKAVMSNAFKFVGLENYVSVLTANDFSNAIVNTLRYCLCTISIELAIGLLTAAKLSKGIRGTKLASLCITTPMMISSVAAASCWLWMFSDGYGIINHFLGCVGVQGPLWLTYATQARWAVVIVSVWGAAPFSILLLYAAQTNISPDLFEAARIDGASDMQMYWYVSFPQLRSTILMILLIRIMDSVKMYDIPHILTGGGPANATQFISEYIYRRSFDSYKFGESAAGSYIITVFVVIVSLLVNHMMKEKSAHEE